VPAFQPVPRSRRSCATWPWWSATTGHDALIGRAARRSCRPGARRHLFDVYKPAQPVAGMAAGERSLAVRLELLDDDATLTDDRIDAAVAAAVARATPPSGARLRG
jgi:phenylalanyl-tRNA synthetase beta chain